MPSAFKRSGRFMRITTTPSPRSTSTTLMFSPLLRLCSRSLHETAPLESLGLEEAMELISAESHRFRAQIRYPLAHLGQAQYPYDLLIQPGQYRFRRPRAGHHAVPRSQLEAGESRFGHGWNFRSDSGPLGRGDTQRPQFPRFRVWQRHRQVAEIDLDLSGLYVDQRRRRALVRDMDHLHSGQCAEELT